VPGSAEPGGRRVAEPGPAGCPGGGSRAPVSGPGGP
jgi:hypothetical protein